MTVPENVKSFRIELANDIRQLEDALLSTELLIAGNLSSIITTLKNERAQPLPEEATKASYWGYKLENYRILFSKSPRHTYPKEASNISLIFEIHVVADHDDINLIKDPFKYLAFNVLIEGNNGEKRYINAMHLDRHLGGETLEAHPIYHIQFGGDKLNKHERDFGEALFLDAPRLVHYPMELVLGIDFIISNFFPEAWQTLRKNGAYVNLLQKYQNFFWKPFAYAMASHWKDYDPANIKWSSKDVCPNLLP